jgi:hypothetical protein
MDSIMAFPRRRGRPKRTNPTSIDKGTIELMEKRKAGITSEPLDLCWSRGLINELQHASGIRLRWLYTLRFGAPTLSAYSPDRLGGHSCKYEDGEWLRKRQNEYRVIIEHLEKKRLREIVVDVCVFSRMPEFLYKSPGKLGSNQLNLYKDLNSLICGLDEIDRLSGSHRTSKAS